MADPRVQRLKEILLEAQDVPREELGAFLDRACEGDPDLRREAASLLAHATREALRTGGLDDAIREAVADLPEGSLEDHPARIGPYRILGVLGHGGMGAVYRALQTSPIEREVALKLVRWSFDSRRILARFEAERRILARMEHPGIARALDAGTSAEGLPYFVMELVDGVPITDYCRTHGLSTRARVGLFLEVCRAVQHAHQKGVLHRDLKPSNLLVTEVDGQPVVKVIDFGIAKAVEEEDRAGTLMTREGQLLGTLEYMSPEQAQGTNAALDIRSDVYALGVVLYEMLAGRLPYDLEGLPTHEAARRVIEEPPAPLHGRRASTTGVSRDLQVIVFKALEKDPERRYATVAALAEDLELLLADQPIRARTPSTAYQLRKLIARNRGPVVFAATLFVLLVAFGVTMSVLFAGQRRERQRAELEAKKAERISEFLQTMITASGPGDAGGETTISDLLDTAAAKLDSELVEEPEIRIALAGTLAEAYEELEQYDAARSVLLSALAAAEDLYGTDDPALCSVLESLTTEEYYAGHLDRAEEYATRASEILKASPRPDRKQLAAQVNNLAFLQSARGDLDRAEATFREAVTLRGEAEGLNSLPYTVTLSGLSRILTQEGEFEEAREAARRVAEIRAQLLPEGHAWRYGGGTLERLLGNYAAAESLFLRDLEWARASGEDTLVAGANAWSGLADLYLDEDRMPEAERDARRALGIAEGLLGSDHFFVARLRLRLARVLRMSGQLDEADSLYELVEAPLVAALGDSVPDVGVLLDEEGEIQMARSRPEAAEPLLRRSLAIFQADFHDDHWRVSQVRIHLAACLAAQGRDDEADSLLQAGLAHLDRMPVGARQRAIRTAKELHATVPLPPTPRTPPAEHGG